MWVRSLGQIPGSERFPGDGNGNPLQYSCLENSMDRVAYSPCGRKELDTTEHKCLTLQRIGHFLKTSLVFSIVLFSSISLHCSLKKAFLSLLAIPWNSAFNWVYLSFFPLPLASPLFSSQLLVKPPQTTICLFAFLFPGDGLDPCLLYRVTNLCPQFLRHSIRSNPLNLFVTFTVQSLGI